MVRINIKKSFSDDFISREAGEKLRILICDEVEKKNKVIVDFSGMIIASASFFDEGFAKLVDHGFNKEKSENFIRIEKIHPRDKELLMKLVKKRFSEKQTPEW